MSEQQDNVFMEVYETLYRLNQDDNVRMWCEAREEAKRVARTIEQEHEREIAWREAKIADQKAKLEEKDSALTENKQLIAEQDAEIAKLKRMLAEKNVQSD